MWNFRNQIDYLELVLQRISSQHCLWPIKSLPQRMRLWGNFVIFKIDNKICKQQWHQCTQTLMLSLNVTWFIFILYLSNVNIHCTGKYLNRRKCYHEDSTIALYFVREKMTWDSLQTSTLCHSFHFRQHPDIHIPTPHKASNWEF